MRAVVTGASGFIGRNVVKRLIRDGWVVDPVDIRPSKTTFGNTYDALDWFHDKRHVTPDLVVHCAAFIGGRLGIENQGARIAAHDTHLDAAMFDWALTARPKRIVYWSSSAAYPAVYQSSNELDEQRPLHEDDINLWAPKAPETSYGDVKLTGEWLASWIRGEGIPVTVLRPFSGYGSDQNQDYPFPAFITRAKLRIDPFEVWGNGEQVRDFIHVDDVVEVMMQCVENGIDGPLNVCSGEGTSFSQLAELVCQAAGYTPELKRRTDMPTGVQYRVGDAHKMLSIYKPQVTLEDGIRRALDE